MTAPRKAVGNTTIQAARTILHAAAERTVAPIPSHRRSAKIVRSLVGALIVAVSLAVRHFMALEWMYAGMGVLLGLYVADKELTKKFFTEFLPGVLGGIRKAVKGEG